MKKTLAIVLALVLALGLSIQALADSAITVVSREDGSGTRGAFIELFKVQVKDADGKNVDQTTEDAEITNSTEVMMTSVAGNPAAIGYVSLGSLNDTVKALEIDGVAPSAAGIKDGTYKISRPFNIMLSAKAGDAAKAFVDYILSADGQKVVTDNGYVAVKDDAAAFAGSTLSGKIVVAGSSSVTPIMEKLSEAYKAVNPNCEIEVQQSDSTTGVQSTIDGICDIGMASRELKDSETSQGLSAIAIAMDGIAVIVNKDNALNGLTSEQVRSIYTGETTDWSALNG
jgi:phosphate transport system substrate-binding protein